MSKENARKTILSRRAKFVAAAIAATGIAIVDESRSRGAPRDAGADARARTSTTTDAGAGADAGANVLERADALRVQGQLIEAIALLREERDSRPPKTEAAARRLTERLLEYEAVLPTIILLTRDQDGNDVIGPVTIDGTERFADRQPMPINPGRHTIVFQRDGGPSRTETILIREGDKGRVIEMGEANPRPCLSPLRDENEERRRSSSHGCSCDLPGISRRSTD